ncbi:MAG TPA: RIP metalloprotease RseP [Chthoniobacterales bacterium]
MFENILRVVLIVLEVVLIFHLLIIVHELGHFLAARWRGLHVEKFGIWFGRPLLKRTFHGVEFSLGWIPAGGFVLLPQMAPMDAVEGKPEAARSSLPPISPLDKIIVAFAGPLFSFLLALAFATVVWVVGRPTAEAEATTVVGYVAPDQPAAKAGFLPGDKLLEVDGHPVSRFSGIVNSVTWYIVRSEGETIPFKVQRGNEVLTLNSGYTRAETKGWERRSLRQVGLQPAITPIVAKVTDGSPAARAGLQPNDEIVAVDGIKLYYPQQIFEWAQKAPGKELTLTVLRDGRPLQLRMEPSRPVIASVIRNGPAEVAGIRAGDRVLALNNLPIYDPAEVVRFIEEKPSEPFSLQVASGRESPRVVRVLPATPDGRTKPIIGVEFSAESNGGIAWDAGGRMTVAHIPPLEQISAAMQTLTNTIGALMSPQSDIKLQHMSGPVMIMRTYYLLFQSDVGWQLALWFSVVFNINLAIINLLPIPVLDGGHILLALVESVRRRPINLRVLEALQGACAIFLIGFMLYVSFYDVQDLPWSNNQKPHFSVPAKPAPPGNR